MEHSKVVETIKKRFAETGNPVEIPLLRGKRGNNTFTARIADDGIYVSNLAGQPFLPWEVFIETVALLNRKGGRAKKGDAMRAKLGEEGLPLDSVEGHVASKVYQKDIGESVFRGITPITCILI